MLVRFCLYGFLKNQRYFEPFLVLVYLDRGMSFTAIGWLVAMRELTINLLEIPSGAVADVWGRRRCLGLSFVAYIAAFLILGTQRGVPATFGAVLLIAVGDAYRSGTHKALIFAWLRLEGRENERTRVYGLTRSWSKIGSAVSVVGGAGIVIATGRFEPAFLIAIAPYLLGLANLATYPAGIDVAPGQASLRGLVRHTGDTFRTTFGRAGLRRLVLESSAFEGAHTVVGDYLQPALLALAAGGTAILLSDMTAMEAGQVARVTAPVYLVLALLGSLASRNAWRTVSGPDGETRASSRLWAAAAVTYALLTLAGSRGLTGGVIAAFLVLYALQNLWRPVIVALYDRASAASQVATTLSIDSQARRLVAAVLAPAVGMAVDGLRARGDADIFWPLGALGLTVSLIFLFGRRWRPIPSTEGAAIG